MSLYNLASGELKKENNKLKEEIERLKKIIDGMIDNEEEYCLEINRLNNIINELKEYCGNTTILHAGKILNIIERSNKNE